MSDSVSKMPNPLTPDQLRRTCDAGAFSFGSTAELPPPQGRIGQDRAVKAMEFGLYINSPGYNIFMAGAPGTGKRTYAQSLIREVAQTRPVPDDWCYVFNFREPDRPLPLRFPAGQGRKFRAEMSRLVADILTDIPKAFESGDFARRRADILEKFQDQSNALFVKVEEEAAKRAFTLKRTESGLATIPVGAGGKPLTQEEYERLPEAARGKLAESQEEIHALLGAALHEVKRLERGVREMEKELQRELAQTAAHPHFEEIREKFSDNEGVLAYLEMAERDVAEHAPLFRSADDAGGNPQAAALAAIMGGVSGAAGAVPGDGGGAEMGLDEGAGAGGDGVGGGGAAAGTGGAGGAGAVGGGSGAAAMGSRGSFFSRYRVNLLVDNYDKAGAPVVLETNPTYYNLLGSIEYRGQFGVAATDFTMIKAGAIHRANGGYLILQAEDVLNSPSAWPGLKRALKTGEIRVENIGDQAQMVPTATLRPGVIPLNVKVVLMGSPYLHLILHNQDEDFKKLFKVKAEFEGRMDRTPENELAYAQFVGSVCKARGLRHFDCPAVAKVIEYSSRLAEDQTKLSARFNDIAELIYEANAWAGVEAETGTAGPGGPGGAGGSGVGAAVGDGLVKARHVEKALDEKIYRSNAMEARIQEMMQRGIIMVDTDGEAVGQVNGLAVIDLGDYQFGRPSRITASIAMGRAGVINIERESSLSGNIHNKGVLILSGYLASHYAQDKPLALTASLAFEQAYEEVDGDSASSTELYAILSGISGIPLKQYLAVTGSVNQRGEIQPVGGVHHKIEGFFATCKAKGLTGRQGVLIPHQNVTDLMLKEEVVEAVRAGKFAIYPVHTVAEGMEILTGMAFGKPGEAGTVSDAVDKGLRRLAEGMVRFGKDTAGVPW